MRTIDSIIIHCSATPGEMDFTAADIDGWHRKRGFNGIGYHYVIGRDGTVEPGRPIEKIGAHCKGWNERSIGICYIGGVNAKGKPKDTRTEEQKRAMEQLIEELKRQYPIKKIMGHRDMSSDLNGNGEVEPQEFIKACPCFDVRQWLKGLTMVWVIVGALCGCGSKKAMSSTVRTELENEIQTRHTAYAETQLTGIDSMLNVEDVTEQTLLMFRKQVVDTFPDLIQVVRTTRHMRSRQAKIGEQVVRTVNTDSVLAEHKGSVSNRQEEKRSKKTQVWWLLPLVVILLVAIRWHLNKE